MNTVHNLMPGYRESEYQVVLLPHEELRNRIIDTRKNFADKFKVSYSPLPAHLTLVRFKILALQEERLRSRLKQIAMGFQPFKIELKDFGSYPTHSIFINVGTRGPIDSLTKELKSSRRLMKAGPSDPQFLDEPNFVIARKLLPWQFEQGWKEYSHKSFTARFVAQDMMLLKKSAGSNKWQVVERLEFMNLPVLTKQGELF